MCGGDGSKRLAFKLSCVADTEKCTSRDVVVRVCQSQTLWFYMHEILFLVLDLLSWTSQHYSVNLGSLQGFRSEQ